ncbi:MAG: ABC transporter substrate-binding protein, partial [Clostridiales bacterium]|nr:ABC transporter substrate-binding protein [Clostridiales bacterium]
MICLIAAVSSGCSSQNTAVSDVVTPSPPPTETFSPPIPTSTPAPQAGGLLNISIREPKTFNPLVNDDVTVDLMLGLVFEPLIVFDEQMKPEPNGRIISDITVNTAVPTAQITIKANAVWADGSPITATDIVYSLDTIKNAENSLYKSCVNYIAGYSSSGNKTVTINFTETYASVLYKLNFPIIPANFSEETPVGSGLYKITEYTPRKGVR